MSEGAAPELSSQPAAMNIVELPGVAVYKIIEALEDLQDRRHLALSCKTFCEAVRSRWRTLVVPFDDETCAVPPGLAHWSGLKVVVWADKGVDVEAALAESQWPETNPSFEVLPDPRKRAEQPGQLARLQEVHSLLGEALGMATPTEDAEEAETNFLVKAALGRFVSLVTSNMDKLQDRLQHATNEEVMHEIVDEVLRVPLEQHHDQQPPLLHAPPKHQLRLVIALAAPLRGRTLQSMFASPSTSNMVDFFDSTATPQEMVRTLSQARFNWLDLYQEIDVGHWEVDGLLPAHAVRGTATWCPHATTSMSYTRRSAAHMRALRLRVKGCDTEEAEAVRCFAQGLAPQLRPEVMPALRELHIGRPFSSRQYLPLDGTCLQLPSLTSLVLNEMVRLRSFASLTHLTSLRSLAVAMPEPGAGGGWLPHPQDLSSLATIASLRSLKLEFWWVTDDQDVASLQQLTELELGAMSGAVAKVKPDRPMPCLAGVTFTQLPEHQDMRYREDSKLARWGLRHAAKLLPGVQVLHLGPLGSAPAAVRREAELVPAASVVDSNAAQVLAKARASLQYLQLDTVLNITDDGVDKRCSTGCVELETTLQVGGIRWTRSVEFTTCHGSDVLVAEFHYARSEEQEEGGAD